MDATETRPRIQAVRADGRAVRLHLRRVYAEWADFAAPDTPEHLVPLAPGEVVVFGRAPDATVQLAHDGSVSRHHASVRADPDSTRSRVVVRDLGSRNGTFVDGLRITEPAVAEVNAVVEVGGTLYVVGCEAGDQPAAPPARFHARSASMRALWARLVRVADSEASALLLGELGTGKTHVARLLHEMSPRRGGPFVLHNCSAIPINLEEATLFGVVSGFIPGVKAQDGLLTRAKGGTLFLDELADMPERAQARLHDAFDPTVSSYLPVGGTERLTTDCRLVSATNRDVFALAVEGRLRHDLLSRLVVGQLEVPPLRERREDLLAILHDALVEGGVDDPQAEVPDVGLARELLLAPWVENVRGLRSLAQRVALGEVLSPARIRQHAGRGLATQGPAAQSVASISAEATAPWPPAADVLLETLAVHGWKVTAAANAFGCRRETLARLLTRTFGPGGGKAARRAWKVWKETGRLPEPEPAPD